MRSTHQKNKTEKKKSRKIAPLASAIGGILIAGSFSFTTFAWLHDSVDSPGSTISTANYAVEIQVDGAPLTVGSDCFASYTVEANSSYTVGLTASGTATTGFVIVKIGDENYFSEQLEPSESVSFTLESDQETTVKIGYRWGRHGKTSGMVGNGSVVTIGSGVLISSKTENSGN